MTLIYNGTTIDKVVYNGKTLDKVTYNGKIVFEYWVYKTGNYLTSNGTITNTLLDSTSALFDNSWSNYNFKNGWLTGYVGKTWTTPIQVSEIKGKCFFLEGTATLQLRINGSWVSYGNISSSQSNITTISVSGRPECTGLRVNAVSLRNPWLYELAISKWFEIAN